MYEWVCVCIKMHKYCSADFSGGPVVENPPCNARDTGSIPGPGRFHMVQSNCAHVHSYWASALEPSSQDSWVHAPQLLKPLCTCSATREATSMRSPCTLKKSSPHLLQLEKACEKAMKIQCCQKKKRVRQMWFTSFTWQLIMSWLDFLNMISFIVI